MKHDAHLLTAKPVLYVANVDEDALATGNDHSAALEAYAAEQGAQVVRICGKIEAELSELPAEEKREFERARRYDADGYREAAPKRTSGGRSDSITTSFAKSFARQLGTKSGQALVRGILGSIFGKR